nr:hypothetical protein [Tanacetum cinerariifolium]
MHTRQETRNLRLKAITDKNVPVSIRFEFGDRETLMPLGDHAAHWTNYLGELVSELPLQYPSWRQMPPERKAGVVAKIGVNVARSHGDNGGGEDRPLHTMYPAVAWVALLTETQFDMRHHMESDRWPQIYADIQQHLRE